MHPWIARSLIYLPVQFFRGEHVLKYMDEIRQFHAAPYRRKCEIQFKKLASLLRFLHDHNPYYREIMKSAGLKGGQIDHIDDFTKLPLLSKDIIRREAAKMVSDCPSKVSRRKTSGSTGIPLSFVKDRDSTAYMDALMYEVYGWHGIEIGDRQGRVWGVPLDAIGRLRVRAKDRFLNRRRLSAFDISDRSCKEYLAVLKSFSPKFVYGLPSTIQAFATTLRETGVDPAEAAVGLVVTTGEILTPRARQEIAGAFKCRVVNEYGTTENGIIAFESPDSALRQMMHNLYIEIVNPDTNQPVSFGESGEVVITELHSYSMPFVRYRVGDLATQGAETEQSSAELPSLRDVIGRVSDLIVTPEGNKVAAAILDYSLTTGVKRFKAFQNSVDSLHVMLEVSDGFEKRSLQVIESNWRRFLGETIRIDFELVETIPPSKSGKMTVLESELTQKVNR
jgi:phenylacetate-CoA ligase